MYKINVKNREINWIRVIIAISILIIICFIFYFSAEKIKKNKINKQNKIKQNEIIAQQIEAKAEAERQKQEQEKTQKEKMTKRYSKLSNEDIEKIDNIYKYSDIYANVDSVFNDVKAQAAAKLKEEGIANVDWNALTNDADGAKTEEQIMDSFYKTIKNETSVVLLMHDSADKILTYGTLPNIIKYFKDNGYKFETIYDLLDR